MELPHPHPNTPQTPTGIDVTFKTNNITVGATRQLSYTLTPEGAESAITWTSDNEPAATVDGSGLVSGVGGGTANITATTANGLTDTVVVNVTAG